MLRPAALCPSWQYSSHPDRVPVLRAETEAILSALRSGELNGLQASSDTRPVHRRLFGRLTPPGHPQYAGHYRGERVDCLWDYDVFIASDPRVGFHHTVVLSAMSSLALLIEQGCSSLDQAHENPRALPDEDLRLHTVAFACRVFELFLRVHPYADGNGHVGRFSIWAVLGRYGYWPKRWPIEPRPPDPPYSELIARHRSGDTEPLERFVLATLI